MSRVLAATQKAGGLHRSGARGKGRGAFGRGRAASLSALRGLTSRSRGVVIKARVVRHGPKSAPLTTHLSYLQRDGVTRDGAPDECSTPLATRRMRATSRSVVTSDRHHFRFIVSPDDAAGTFRPSRLHPRSHERDGARSRDQDSIGWRSTIGTPSIPTSTSWCGAEPTTAAISLSSRDYISRGFRARAEQLVTSELGPRSEQEIRRSLERQVDADRWTPLDQALARGSGEAGWPRATFGRTRVRSTMSSDRC